MEYKYRLEKAQTETRECQSLGYHLCESQVGLIDEMCQSLWCEYLDGMCGSPDIIDIRSDTVKYVLGGAASMIGSPDIPDAHTIPYP